MLWSAISPTANGISLGRIKNDYLLLDFAGNNGYDWLASDLERMNYIHTRGRKRDGTVLRDGDDCRRITGLTKIKKPLFGNDS